LTKRLLGLSYLWVGNHNGVEIQIYATWIFYALINDICADVAVAMNQPLEAISVEMVFRGLYHFNTFFQRDEASNFIDFLSSNAKVLGILKAQRPKHRLRDSNSSVPGLPLPTPLS
jgi:hypothetical protein